MEQSNFKNIVERYYPMLYRFALGLVCSEADACDLTQQAFSSWAAKKNPLCDDAQTKLWLLAELYRQFQTDDRHENRSAQLGNLAQDEVQPCGMPQAVDRLVAGEVMECLQSINETFRVPLLLFYLGEQSFKEIAGILEIPSEVAISRLSTGKRELQSALLRRLEVAGSTTSLGLRFV